MGGCVAERAAGDIPLHHRCGWGGYPCPRVGWGWCLSTLSRDVGKVGAPPPLPTSHPDWARDLGFPYSQQLPALT